MKKKQVHLLDELWSGIIKHKAKFQCEHCGIAGVRMEAAHVVGRRHRATRWGCTLPTYGGHLAYDLCGHCFCHMCHLAYDEHGPIESAIVFKTIGIPRKDFIQREAIRLVAKNQNYAEIREELVNYARVNLEREDFKKVVGSEDKGNVC